MDEISTHERGITAVLFKKWILEKYGNEGLKRVLSRLSIGTKKLLSDPVPADWYPVHLMKEIYQAVDDEFGCDDPDALIKMGRFVAEASIKGFLRYLARLLTVEQLIKRVGRFWKHYHRGGSIEAEKGPEEGGRKKGIVRIYGYPGGVAGCKAMQGYIEAMLTKAGVRDLVVEKKTCLNKGDEVCTWTLDWADH